MIINSSKEKGRAGLSLAIAYFGTNGYTVSLPLNDTQDYDLIVDKNNILSKIQVKFTARLFKSKTTVYYQVDLRSMGGSNGSKIYSDFLNSSADYLFIATDKLDLYFIPKKAIHTTTSLILNEEYNKYKVNI